MKKIELIVVLLFCVSVGYAQNRSINFEKVPYEKLVEKAKQEGKFLFLDFYAQWCEPCKKMAKEVFTNNAVADYVNGKYLSLSIDVDTPRGMVLRKKFDINAMPTLIVLDSNGKEMMREVKAYSANEFVERLKQLENGAPTPLYQMAEAYKTKKKDAEFIATYRKELAANYMFDTEKQIYEEYLKGVAIADYVKPEYWNLFTSKMEKMRDHNYTLLMKNLSVFKGRDLTKVKEALYEKIIEHLNDNFFHNEEEISDLSVFKITKETVEDFDKLEMEEDLKLKIARIVNRMSGEALDEALNLLIQYASNGDFSNNSNPFEIQIVLGKLFHYGIIHLELDDCRKMIAALDKIILLKNLSDNDRNTFQRHQAQYADKMRYIIEDAEIEKELKNNQL